MELEERQAKPLIAGYGLAVPRGGEAATPEEARARAAELAGPVVVKAQVPAGKRGKAGGILFADGPAGALDAAAALLGAEVGGHRVERVLVEERVEIERELYAAVLNDPGSKGPLLLFSTAGGMDVEEIADAAPERLVRRPVDILDGLDEAAAAAVAAAAGLPAESRGPAAAALASLYRAYRGLDAELLEVNPLALDRAGGAVAVDCKLSLDDGALPRHPELAGLTGPSRNGTELERRGRELGLLYIELDGDVGVLANGAGLTMTTMDAIALQGGRPANFLEIGGANYSRAAPALKLVLDNPRVRSLLVNFCGAFARTDVMTEGVLAALDELRPRLPVHFSVHGTGEESAVAMLRGRGIEPHETMEEAVRAAIAGAAGAGAAAGEEVAGT